MAHAETDPHPAIVAPGRSVWDRLGLTGAPIGLLLLTLVACLIRAGGLPAVQGTMGRDEARLGLAALGILQHGIPILPDGFLYTRGLLPAYLDALTFPIFGSSDQSARLTDLVFASLLVPAVYRLGKLAGGSRPAIAAAIIVAFSPPLVLQAREAWLYSTFLFWLTMSLGWLVRDDPGDRLKAGLAALAALFSHELAVLLVPVALLLDLSRAWQARRHPPGSAAILAASGSGQDGRAPRRTWRSVALFWTLLLGGVAVVVILSLTLRAQTLGGPTVEFREYLRPTLDVRGLATSLGILSRWHAWLLPVAILGLPLSRSGWRKLLVGRGIAPSLLMLGVVVAFNSFGLVRRGESRYMLAAIPFAAIVAAVALDRVGPPVVAVLAGRPLRQSRHLVRFVLLTLLVVSSLDPARLVTDARSRAVSSTWVQALTGRDPNDLVVSFAPTLTSFYLGRTDFWLRTEGFTKYVWAGRTPLRDVHTGAILLRNQSDLDRLLLAPNQGRRVWVVLAGEPAAESSRLMRDLTQRLAALAVEMRRPADGRVVLLLQL